LVKQLVFLSENGMDIMDIEEGKGRPK